MPWAFIQRIAIRKRKLTTARSTLMRHSLSYRDWLESSNTEVATRALPPVATDREWSFGGSDIEGKVTRVGASEHGQRTSFNGADGISDIEGKELQHD